MAASARLCLPFLLCTLAGAQQTLLPTRTYTLELTPADAQRQITGATYLDGATLLILAKPSRLGTRDGDLFSVSPGAVRRLNEPAMLVRAVSGEWAYEVNPQTRAGQLRNLRTNTSKEIDVGADALAAAFSNSQFFTLHSDPRLGIAMSTLSVFDAASGQRLDTEQLQIPIGRGFLSVLGDNTLLVTDAAAKRVAEYAVDGGRLRAVRSYELTGREIEDSLRRAVQPAFSSNGAAHARLVIACLPGPKGNSLFQLSPWKAAEGLRLVEYDSTGNEISSLRLKAETDAAAKTLSASILIPGKSATSLLLVARGGVVREYSLP
jgi:hypothetical protein